MSKVNETAQTAQDAFTGSCLCGAVRFCIAPAVSKWCAHCHCGMCRKAHGAGFVTWVGVESGHFSISAGEEHLRWYASSPGARRGFCGTCGSTLLFESEQWAGETHVARGNFDGEIDRSPQLHAFYATHVDWCRVDDGLKIRP